MNIPFCNVVNVVSCTGIGGLKGAFFYLFVSGRPLIPYDVTMRCRPLLCVTPQCYGNVLRLSSFWHPSTASKLIPVALFVGAHVSHKLVLTYWSKMHSAMRFFIYFFICYWEGGGLHIRIKKRIRSSSTTTSTLVDNAFGFWGETRDFMFLSVLGEKFRQTLNWSQFDRTGVELCASFFFCLRW